MASPPQRGLALPFCVIVACFLALLAIHDWNAHVPAFLCIYLAACLAYAVAVRFARQGRFDSIPHLSTRILLGGILLRLIVFWCPPTLSEDIYRYAWDGKTQNAGFGPYDYPPEAGELKALRDADYERINHKDLRTPYPPGAELLFRLLAAVSTNHILFKLVVTGFDLLLLFLLRGLLAAENLPPSGLLIYAWHPLAALEFAANGHMDVIAISLMFLSLLLLARNRATAAGLTLGAAVLTKYLPIVTLPWTVVKGRWKMILAFVAIIIILFIPYYTRDLGIFKGLFVFYRTWWFNDSVFGILRVLFGSAEPARLTGATCIAATGVFCFWKRFPLYRSVFLINTMVIIFAPVVHPWYVLWLVPLLVFHYNPAWLFFSCWIAASYLVLYINAQNAVWQHSVKLQLLVYVPLYAWLLRDGIKMWRERRSD